MIQNSTEACFKMTSCQSQSLNLAIENSSEKLFNVTSCQSQEFKLVGGFQARLARCQFAVDISVLREVFRSLKNCVVRVLYSREVSGW